MEKKDFSAKNRVKTRNIFKSVILLALMGGVSLANDKTWEIIVEPEDPISFNQLEVIVARGQSLTLSTERPELYEEALNYWNDKQVEATLARAKDLADALRDRNEPTVARMTRQIGGVSSKQRLTGASLEEDTLFLALSGTSYMDVVGTNVQAISNPDFRTRLMQAGLEDHADPNFYFANALGVCALLYGKDADGIYVPIGTRSDKVMIYPNVPHIFGGFPDVEGKLVGHLRRELREEIGLTDEEMGESFFYGIIRQVPSRHPEAIFGVPVSVGREELAQRWREGASGKYEHRNIKIYGKEELPGILKEDGQTMVPSCAAALTRFLEYSCSQ